MKNVIYDLFIRNQSNERWPPKVCMQTIMAPSYMYYYPFRQVVVNTMRTGCNIKENNL